ncbi:hypothetical protein Tco_0303198 [Tanacetum coccineum]
MARLIAPMKSATVVTIYSRHVKSIVVTIDVVIVGIMCYAEMSVGRANVVVRRLEEIDVKGLYDALSGGVTLRSFLTPTINHYLRACKIREMAMRNGLRTLEVCLDGLKDENKRTARFPHDNATDANIIKCYIPESDPEEDPEEDDDEDPEEDPWLFILQGPEETMAMMRMSHPMMTRMMILILRGTRRRRSTQLNLTWRLYNRCVPDVGTQAPSAKEH